MKPKRTVKMPLRKPAPSRRSIPAPSRSRAVEEDYEIEDCEAEAEPNMRFSHALFVVLILHVIAVAGVFAFNSIKARQLAEESAKAKKKPAATQTASSTPTPAPKTAPPASTPAARRSHVVAAGDTLSKIASRYRSSVDAICAANGIAATSLLRIGQELIIPEPGARFSTPAPERKKPALATVVASARPPEAARPNAPKAQASQAPAPAAQARSTPPSVKPAGAAPTPAAVKTAAAAPTPAAAPAASPVASLPTNGVYVVAKGDNPYAIAKRFGVSYKKLLEINGIEDPTRVQIGQKLKLPPAP